MSKVLSQKLKSYIMDLAYKSLPFGGQVWDSSAQHLSNDLKNKGIKFDKKLFWKYKLPENMAPQQFQDKIAEEHFCKRFYSDFMSRVLSDKTLTGMEKIEIVRYVWEMRRQKNHKNMNCYADEIKRNNPELADIKPTNSIENFVYGVLFGFAPDEIRYFCEEKGSRNFDVEHNLDEKLENFGVRTTYVLSPNTAEALLNVLEKKQKE